MSRTSIVIKLLLLVIVTGNLALVSVNHAPLVDVEAVAEWRLECDLAAIAAGGDPEMPAVPALQQEFQANVAGTDIPSLGAGSMVVAGTLTPATRGPPSIVAA